MSISRRSLLLATGALGGSALLSACGGSDPSGATAGAPTGELEVFSWWTEGAERNGLLALLDDFKGHQPKLDFVNRAVAGGAGAKAKEELAARLAAGHPPDSFQGHAGAELAGYIAAGRLEGLNPLYEKEKWADHFPAALLPLIRTEGTYYSVPVNIHRANMLWSNPAVLTAAKADPAPTSIEAFLESLQKVKRSGRIPLVLGEAWTRKHLLETVLLAGLGAERWSTLWRKGGSWSSPQVTAALQDFRDLLQLSNLADADPLSWDDATKLLGAGKAGYQVMGDWAEGTLKGSLGLHPDSGYNWAAVPGTSGMFQFLSDSFTLPAKAKHRQAALAWLTECGSLDGQLAFNGAKGSIPARTDFPADTRALFGQYQQWSLDQWQKCEIVGSLTHGVVAPIEWNAEIDAALADFTTRRDLPKFQDALAAAGAKHAT
ncbi:extracellular solute-binding protein [Kitasatospora atroaurantiaca]|uniref:Carbohydrate ABC transporter substrate-binding protein (CUT1 family) n=1 Tax=Kitasatospora atroaurantiaca TaxID=285545 RepID=A0A561EU17_9ACTN|nr:ABC transporter substrate-binding protein [Kitasatospora atroaurantiaca]TWE19100.1 carbohydrate ABC transporter substrate-binding protein (CUT1 family) [Kitasatospora atroaurantiaca]